VFEYLSLVCGSPPNKKQSRFFSLWLPLSPSNPPANWVVLCVLRVHPNHLPSVSLNKTCFPFVVPVWKSCQNHPLGLETLRGLFLLSTSVPFLLTSKGCLVFAFFCVGSFRPFQRNGEWFTPPLQTTKGLITSVALPAQVLKSRVICFSCVNPGSFPFHLFLFPIRVGSLSFSRLTSYWHHFKSFFPTSSL